MTNDELMAQIAAAAEENWNIIRPKCLAKYSIELEPWDRIDKSERRIRFLRAAIPIILALDHPAVPANTRKELERYNRYDHPSEYRLLESFLEEDYHTIEDALQAVLFSRKEATPTHETV